MPEPTLESARTKLQRSYELLDTVEREIEAERVSSAAPGQSPYRIEWHYEGEWAVFECAEILRAPPLRWGTLVGDAMHNARSALDHLACRLVERNGQTPTRTTAFPIWDEKPVSANVRSRFESRIQGMSSADKKSVRALQPYHNPSSRESALLVALAALDNLDKHNDLVPMVTTAAPNPSASASELLPGGIEVRWNPDVEFRPGTEFARARRLSTFPFEFEMRVPVKVTFGDPFTGTAQLREITAYCVGIVESFAPGWSV